MSRASTLTELVMIYYLEHIFHNPIEHVVRKKAYSELDFSKEVVIQYYERRTQKYLNETEISKIGRLFYDFLVEESMTMADQNKLRRIILGYGLLQKFYALYTSPILSEISSLKLNI